MDSSDDAMALDTFDEAQSLFVQGDYSAALVLIDGLVEAYPDKKNLLFARARCLTALGRNKEARVLCLDLIERFDSPRAKSLLDRIGRDGAGDPKTPATLDDLLRAPLEFSDSTGNLISQGDIDESPWGDIVSKAVLFLAFAASAVILFLFINR